MRAINITAARPGRADIVAAMRKDPNLPGGLIQL
jgi:hypothetical protein